MIHKSSNLNGPVTHKSEYKLIIIEVTKSNLFQHVTETYDKCLSILYENHFFVFPVFKYNILMSREINHNSVV